MRSKLALVLLGALTVLSSPLAADWLVTREGGRVETRGAWKVKGKLVVFTRADGSLSSLRLVDVDLEASRKATAAASTEAAKPAAPQPEKKKLAVLTDKDFRKSQPASPPPATPRELPPAAAASPVAAGPVAVASWERVDSPDGQVEIRGTLRNQTDGLIANAAVEVQLYDEAGNRVGTVAAILASPVLDAGATTDFRARFPGVFFFDEVKFDARGLPLDIAPAPEQPAATPPQ